MKKKEHLIIGFGKWGKKIFKNIKNQNYFEKIYIKSRSENLIFYKNKLKKINKINLKKKYYSAHICMPVNKHYIYAKKLKVKKLIIEKPTFHNLKSYTNFFNKKQKIITNYSDLLSPGFFKVYDDFRKTKNGKFILTYRNKTLKYEKDFECIVDWLDHPLSIILYFFKDIKSYKILNFKRYKIGQFICENLKLKIINKNYNIILNLKTNSEKKKLRKLDIKTNKSSYNFDFYKSNYKIKKNKKVEIIKSKNNSIINVYDNFVEKNNILFRNHLDFSKKIYLIKEDIIKKIKKSYE